ncbi:MAG: hydrogenase nickel incorporation protein HypA [Elusimicrobia bacterium]|nr:hydrogenase nickel incorporation protein HypA [Elusimicrobiota bacterium]
MHEWALAESVIKAAREHAAGAKLRVLSEVGVVLGELQAIDRKIFSFALAELAKGPFREIGRCRFRLIKAPAAFKCRACAKEFTLKVLKRTGREGEYIHFIPELAHAFLKCPKCKSPDFEITAGRGVSIKYIKGEQ